MRARLGVVRPCLAAQPSRHYAPVSDRAGTVPEKSKLRMTNTELLGNAPLIEVIAEIHWKLPTSSSQGSGSHDHFWFSFANAFSQWAKSDGYEFTEQLVSAGITVPLDMLGRAPIYRFRPAPGQWPLVQIGQGLLTVNAVPPYDGWNSSIAPRLEKALAKVFEAREGTPALAVEKLELHYMDAFTEKHGVNDVLDYLGQEVSLFPPCPPSWQKLAKQGGAMAFSGEYKFMLESPVNSVAIAKYGQGTVNLPRESKSLPAALFNFIVQSNPGTVLAQQDILDWFDKAHTATASLFSGALSERVKRIIA